MRRVSGFALFLLLVGAIALASVACATAGPAAKRSWSSAEIATIGIAGTVYIAHKWGTATQPWLDADPACAPSSGSGAYLGNGQVLTAAHVVLPLTSEGHTCWPDKSPPDAFESILGPSPSWRLSHSTISVRDSSGSVNIGTVLVLDTNADLALLSVPNLDGISALAWGDSGELRIGDPIWAVGYPITGATVTKGIVSALKSVPGKYRSARTIDLVQTDAAVNPGNSGGPLLNEKGELVGIVDFRVEGGNFGLNFAVASSTARVPMP